MLTPPDDDRPNPSAPPATAIPNAADTIPEPEIGIRWGTFPTPERQAALDARLAEWDATPDHGELLGPFDSRGWRGGEALTGAEVYYLAARSLAGIDADIVEVLPRFTDPETLLNDLHLEHACLFEAQLNYACLNHAHLERANLLGAQLAYADLGGALLQYAQLPFAQLDHAICISAYLDHALLSDAILQHADLRLAHLDHANLRGSDLASADLREAYLDVGTDLTNATLTDAEHGSVRMADVRWQGVNLAVVKDWPAYMALGDEQVAWKLARERRPLPKAQAEHREAMEEWRDGVRWDFRAAARANRQLAAAMRDQGMNDEADHFAYRAQVMQRELYRHQGRHFRAGFSHFLDLIAGYGYKPVRSAIAYVLVIFAFAAAYFTLGHLVGPVLSPLGAAVFSMTSFHGRGFFPGGIGLDDPITVLAALEALCGLIIEVSLIATFTQRFFGR